MEERGEVLVEDQDLEVQDRERYERALRIRRNYTWFSMGAGLIPVPFVDFAAISGLQLKMIYDLCRLYETPFKEQRGKSIIMALLGYIVPESLTKGILGSMMKAIPVVGPITGALSMPIFTGATTYAIGSVFIRHFEMGGTLLDFEPEKVKEYFKKKFEEGKKYAENLRKEQKSETRVEPTKAESKAPKAEPKAPKPKAATKPNQQEA